MVFAEIRGKLGSNAERASERSEDVLTSTVLGTLRYLPVRVGLGALLERAHGVELNSGELVIHRGVPWLTAEELRSCVVEFWPRLGEHGEVDAILRFSDEIGKLTHIILVEAKYLSPKSRRAEDDEEDDDEAPDANTDPDQLVDYWLGGQKLECASTATVALVYLTAHSTPPLFDLGESLRRCPTMRLAWLSWRDVWAVARAAAATSGSLPARDLVAYLEHKGLSFFDGFRISGSALGLLPPPHHRFTERDGFRLRAAVPLGVSAWSLAQAHFWRG